MVAGMVYALAHGKSVSEMAYFGVACGTAATMTPGTQLCKKEDAEQLNSWITAHANALRKNQDQRLIYLRNFITVSKKIWNINR